MILHSTCLYRKCQKYDRTKGSAAGVPKRSPWLYYDYLPILMSSSITAEQRPVKLPLTRSANTIQWRSGIITSASRLSGNRMASREGHGMPVDVFISYRGADRVLARRLEQRLRSRWGSRVFRDETSLMPGRPWSEQLLAAMSQANVTLALVGPGWHIREKGEDWVRDELLSGIALPTPVVR